VVGNITSVNYLFYDWDELAVATGFSRQHQLPVRSSPTSTSNRNLDEKLARTESNIVCLPTPPCTAITLPPNTRNDKKIICLFASFSGTQCSFGNTTFPWLLLHAHASKVKPLDLALPNRCHRDQKPSLRKTSD
jgi:hypothetical protein